MTEKASKSFRFTARQLRLIEWLAETKHTRIPSTEKELAANLGVTDRTLRNWKNKPGFQEAVKERARELLGNRLAEILSALGREAEKGSYQHIKLALEMTGEYTPTERHELSGKDGGPIVVVNWDRLELPDEDDSD